MPIHQGPTPMAANILSHGFAVPSKPRCIAFGRRVQRLRCALRVKAAISFEAAPPEALIAGAAIVVGTAALLVSEAIKSRRDSTAGGYDEESRMEDPNAALPRENAVLVSYKHERDTCAW